MNGAAQEADGPASSLVLAIDGPAASGKGTIARRLAARYRLAHLDTGLLYRAVGAKAQALGRPLEDASAAATVARGLEDADLDRPELRGETAAQAASVVARHPEVRAALLSYQRAFAAEVRPGGRGAILDGRDIGTVVLPDATAKLFITAAAEERARRRAAELEGRGGAAPFEAVLADIAARDRRDRFRPTSPLAPAADAHLIDTTDLDIDAAFALAISVIERYTGDLE